MGRSWGGAYTKKRRERMLKVKAGEKKTAKISQQ